MYKCKHTTVLKFTEVNNMVSWCLLVIEKTKDPHLTGCCPMVTCICEAVCNPHHFLGIYKLKQQPLITYMYNSYYLLQWVVAGRVCKPVLIIWTLYNNNIKCSNCWMAEHQLFCQCTDEWCTYRYDSCSPSSAHTSEESPKQQHGLEPHSRPRPSMVGEVGDGHQEPPWQEQRRHDNQLCH